MIASFQKYRSLIGRNSKEALIYDVDFVIAEFYTGYRESTMDQELLKVLRHGNEHQIKQLASRNPNIFSAMSPRGNTILHMAIKFGNQHVIPEILRRQNSLLHQRNWKGESPLHIVARSSHVGIISILLQHVPAITDERETESILRITDNEGNTPLHYAVRNKHEYVVQMLVAKDNAPILYVNNVDQTPLSIAIDANLTNIACFIIKECPDSLNHRGPEELTLLHTAIIRQDYDIMVKILETKIELMDMLDWHWRNPLHYAAALGNVKMMQRLLVDNKELAYKCDRYGETALHLAAENGQLNFLKVLLNDYPDVIEVLNNKNQSILHLAAEYGHLNVVSFILTLPEMEDLINLHDDNGNTPLHLAAMNFNSDVVYKLSRNDIVNIRAKNIDEMTALTIVESSTLQGRDIQKHLTLKSLTAVYAKRALYPEDILKRRHFAGGEGGKGKEMAQTLSVMATLIATFTFTAAFTIPGGFKNDGPDEGMATLVKKAGFQAFVITDTIAMTSSMTAAILVFWSFWRSRSESFMDTLPLAIGLTWIALVSMALAFVTGLFVVLSDNMALAIVVCLIGCTLPLIFYVFAPFFMVISDQTEVNPFAFVVRLVRILCRST